MSPNTHTHTRTHTAARAPLAFCWETACPPTSITLAPFPGNQELAQRARGAASPAMSGSPFIGFSRDHPGVEEISVHCSRTSKEGVGDELGMWSVCLSVGGGLTCLPASPRRKQGPPDSPLQPRSGRQQLPRGSSSLKIKTAVQSAERRPGGGLGSCCWLNSELSS